VAEGDPIGFVGPALGLVAVGLALADPAVFGEALALTVGGKTSNALSSTCPGRGA
jgi:hypothetical protein